MMNDDDENKCVHREIMFDLTKTARTVGRNVSRLTVTLALMIAHLHSARANS